MSIQVGVPVDVDDQAPEADGGALAILVVVIEVLVLVRVVGQVGEGWAPSLRETSTDAVARVVHELVP